MRLSVVRLKLSASGRERLSFICATLSPGIVRNWFPWLSSVVSISEIAVESHDCSDLPDRFLKPSTATVRRLYAVGGNCSLDLRHDIKRPARIRTPKRIPTASDMTRARVPTRAAFQPL